MNIFALNPNRKDCKVQGIPMVMLKGGGEMDLILSLVRGGSHWPLSPDASFILTVTDGGRPIVILFKVSCVIGRGSRRQ